MVWRLQCASVSRKASHFVLFVEPLQTSKKRLAQMRPERRHDTERSLAEFTARNTILACFAQPSRDFRF
jgi:hypothetical protein